MREPCPPPAGPTSVDPRAVSIYWRRENDPGIGGDWI